MIERMPYFLDVLALAKDHAPDEGKARSAQIRERFKSVGQPVGSSASTENDISADV